MKFEIRLIEELSSQQLLQLAKEVRVLVPRLKAKKSARRRRRRWALPTKKAKREVSALQYWAQAIEGVRLNADHELMFLVKWEGYSRTSNTWQLVRDLSDCDLLFADFHKSQFLAEDQKEEYTHEDVQRMSRFVSECASESCDLALLLRLNGHSVDSYDRKSTKELRKSLEHWSLALRRARRVTHIWYKRILVRQCFLELQMGKHFRSVTHFLEFAEQRVESRAALALWQSQVNAQIGDSEPQLELENLWDVEVPPPLVYLARPLLADTLVLDTRMQDTCCECEEDCTRNRSCVCALRLYTDNRRFKTSRVVYECNNACKCGAACPNRRIQKGRQNALTVFRTRDRGWGVFTRQRINFGDFVMEYVGEVLDSRATRARDATYFFNLDSEFCGQTLFVDGKRQGNVTRFANHSCEPNLDVHLAFVQGVDRVPRIAFFANRTIRAFEELTYDYKRSVLSRDRKGEFVRDDDSGYDSRGSNALSETKIDCLCGARKCKTLL